MSQYKKEDGDEKEKKSGPKNGKKGVGQAEGNKFRLESQIQRTKRSQEKEKERQKTVRTILS